MGPKFKLDENLNLTWLSESNRICPPIPGVKFDVTEAITTYQTVTEFVTFLEGVNSRLAYLQQLKKKT